MAEVQEAPKTMGKAPNQDSIEFAVSQLLKEPKSETQTQETPKVEQEESALEEETEKETEKDTLSETESEDEGESEETEEQTESEEEEESESEGEREEEAYYTIKLDGEEYEVTLDELRSGYQRQKDYTKKTQTLAEQRKSLEESHAELAAQHEAYMTQASMANELLNRDLTKFNSVDWESLKTEDPVGYVQKQIELQEIRNKQTQLQTEAQKAWEFNQKAQLDAQAKIVEAERKEMLKVFPEWKNPEKANSAQTKIIEYARGIGYSDPELASIIRARDLQVLDKAMKYDALENSKKGITQKEKPAVRKLVKPKGKAAPGAAKRQKVTESRQRLRKSGSLRDAAALMDEMRSKKVIRK